MSFRRRLALVAAAAVAVAIVIASGVVYLVVHDDLRGEVDSSLEDIAAGATVAGTPLASPVGTALPAPRRGTHKPRRGGIALALPAPPLGAPRGFGQLVDATGRVLRAPGEGGALPVTEEARQVAAGERPAFFSDVDAGGDHLRVLTTPAGAGMALQVARSLGEVDDTLRHLTWVLLVVAVGGVGLAAFLGALVARTTVAPVARLTATAEHVARTRDLAQRIEVEGDDELARLARSFNAMLAELESSVGAQRRLVADASHELRTPLTSLRTNMQVLARANGLSDADRRHLLDDVTTQLEELGGLVAGLLDLARDGESRVEREALRLDRLAKQCVEEARAAAPEHQFATTLEPCEVAGSPDQLRRAVRNLIDNAVKWSPAGSAIEVAVEASGRVMVRDRGPGIDRTDLPRIFDRFYRAPTARGTPGSGLGLAIVRQVVQTHGGDVEAATLPEGGAAVGFRLPALDLSSDSSGALS